MRQIIVGDVHGCRRELEDLLDAVNFDATVDQLIHAGDLVAKGPDSKGVLALVRELGARGVRGNHDEHCLAWRRAQQRDEEPPELRRTHQEVVEALDEEDWLYLESLPLHLHLDDALPDRSVRVVHGGFVPGVPLSEQRPKWLMNLRSLKRGQPSKKAMEGSPWAAHWPGPELVVFGHDAIRGLQRHPHAIGLDTGCCYGGQLTALVFEKGAHRLVHVRAARQYAPVK